MNKSELIDTLAEQTNQSKADTLRFMNALVTTIQDTLAQKDELAHVHISGLGNFSRKSRNARIGRNPKTGEAVNIPAKVVPGFTSSTALKKVVS
jgi:nucleoid DNA-binding protein